MFTDSVLPLRLRVPEDLIEEVVGAFAVSPASGLWVEAVSSPAQLGSNLLGILLAGTATLAVQRAVWQRVDTRNRGLLP